ncbi:MAG: DUF2304 domain-containing protein [Desulfobacterales bacterium]|nr:DUF2304 domain-containing protein [Desulfobacterales bacterium]
MPLHQKLFAILTGLSLLTVIIYLVQKGKLREEYSWLWFLTGVVILVLALWYDVLLLLTDLIGAVTPTTTLFILGIVFLMLISLHSGIKISRLNDQVKNLAQKVSLIEAQINQPKSRTGGQGTGSGEPGIGDEKQVLSAEDGVRRVGIGV